MSPHAAIVDTTGRLATSAEPIDAWDALRICREASLAEFVASCHDVPLLTDDESQQAMGAVKADDSKAARAWKALMNDRRRAREGYVHDGRRWSPDDVVAAALAVEKACQAQLWELGGPKTALPLRYARDLHEAQETAHCAAESRIGMKAARALRGEAAGPRQLLTTCVGTRIRRLPDDMLRKHAPDLLDYCGENLVPLGAGDGCGTIIVDTSAARPSAPRIYCLACGHRPRWKDTRSSLRAARDPWKARVDRRRRHTRPG